MVPFIMSSSFYVYLYESFWFSHIDFIICCSIKLSSSSLQLSQWFFGFPTYIMMSSLKWRWFFPFLFNSYKHNHFHFFNSTSWYNMIICLIVEEIVGIVSDFRRKAWKFSNMWDPTVAIGLSYEGRTHSVLYYWGFCFSSTWMGSEHYQILPLYLWI